MVAMADSCSGEDGGACNSPFPYSHSLNYAVSELEKEQSQHSSLFTKIPQPVKQEQISTHIESENGVSSTSSCEPNDVSFKQEEEIKPVLIVKVKEEINAELIYGGDDNGKFNGGGGDFSTATARPMEGLSEAGPPPFLKKTFEMVDDPATNDVVSWSESGDSFVVWDSHEFSKNLLPKNFKHSNFSSFIRQLNTYGFKKIDPDRWEFANSGFKGGKKHLLKNIKRRSKYNKNHQAIKSSLASDSLKPGLQTELELELELDNLKHDQNSLRVEITKLVQEHKDSRSQITAVEERIRSVECRQNQVMTFLTKTITCPNFVRQLIQRRDRKRELDADAAESCKRNRILSATINPDSETAQSVVTENLSELTRFSTVDGELYSSVQEHEEVKESSVCSDLFSENLVDEISVLDEELSLSDSKFYNELEDLVEKPRDYWGAYMTSLVEQTCFELRG